jgi:hypothetical protein
MGYPRDGFCVLSFSSQSPLSYSHPTLIFAPGGLGRKCFFSW